MIYLKALTFILLFSKCFGSDNDDDYIRNIQDQPIHSPSYSHEWTTPQVWTFRIIIKNKLTGASGFWLIQF